MALDTMKHLEKKIKEHYIEKRLSNASLNRIIALGEEAKILKSDTQPTSTQSSNLHGWLASRNLQVVGILFSVAIILGIFIGKNTFLNDNISNLVLEEISMNHNKRLAVEYPIQEYEALRTAMARLDFKLVPPKILSTNYQLIGGRYCSIQGRLAAQLKIRHTGDGKLATLYITPITERLATITTQQSVTDHVEITLWKNATYLYGLATDHVNK